MCICNDKIHPDSSNPLTALGSICNTPTAQKNGYAFSSDDSPIEQYLSYLTYTDATQHRPCTFRYSTKEIMHMCLPAVDDVNMQTVHG